AVTAYERAIEIAPGFAAAHSSLGHALQIRGDFEGAFAAYRKALEIDPQDALTHYNLGNAYRSHGDLADAISAYEKALEIAPGYAEVHCNLGLALQAQGEFEQAVAHLRAGDRFGRSRKEEWPYDSKRWIVQALGAWSHALYDRKEFARSREVLLRAVKVLPDDPEVLNWVARMLIDPEHDPQVWDGKAALPLATKAVELTRRENPAFLDTLAWARLRSGDTQGAIAVQEEILQKLEKGGAPAQRMEKAREQLAHFRAVLEKAPR
ncbi:MAG: tetratricopeptide repeat protein, partial [Planctomycetota bacterium]